jgi:ribonuclease HIII
MSIQKIKKQHIDRLISFHDFIEKDFLENAIASIIATVNFINTIDENVLPSTTLEAALPSM